MDLGFIWIRAFPSGKSNLSARITIFILVLIYIKLFMVNILHILALFFANKSFIVFLIRLDLSSGIGVSILHLKANIFLFFSSSLLNDSLCLFSCNSFLFMFKHSKLYFNLSFKRLLSKAISSIVLESIWRIFFPFPFGALSILNENKGFMALNNDILEPVFHIWGIIGLNKFNMIGILIMEYSLFFLRVYSSLCCRISASKAYFIPF